MLFNFFSITTIFRITNKGFMKTPYSRNVNPAFSDRWAHVLIRPQPTEEVTEIVMITNK